MNLMGSVSFSHVALVGTKFFLEFLYFSLDEKSDGNTGAS